PMPIPRGEFPRRPRSISIPDLGFRFLYVGQEDVQWDNQLGLAVEYMHSREDAPVLARFIQPDPEQAEANLYAYASNRPTTSVDPTGDLNSGFQGGLKFCVDLYSKIIQRTQDLIRWTREQLRGILGRAPGHAKRFLNAQKVLQDQIDQYRNNGCQDLYRPLPRSVWRMANRPFPNPSQSNFWEFIVTLGGFGAAGGFLWWGGKTLSPLCGPALFLCAFAL
ncbi:MAG: RHS repeat domain-containing protein, partial [bacterium]